MGACRKLEGSMCPSFIATRDEEHSTRGRANLLRAALSGLLPESELTGPRLHQALDLCLECKACKAECDSGVDMAKLKYEFLDNYHKVNGAPLRSKVFAHINRVNRLGSRFAPLSNWMAKSPIGRFVSSAVLGVHPSRSMPPFAAQSFPRWFESRGEIPPNPPLQRGGEDDSSPLTKGGPQRGRPRPTVVLLNDTFMNYNYPEVGRAAVELLEAAGQRVVLANAMCCGRPMLSKGFMAEAAANARYNVDLLHAYADQGIPIVGCEPSCLLTLRDEYPELAKDAKSKKVAQHAYLIDEYLMMLHEKGELDLKFSGESKKVLFHAHCHQKALAGTAASLGALRLPGWEVELVNAGCCGMAGSFGFEKEHYDISMTIGGQALFPAVKAKGDDWEIAVMGVSCRQQIEDGAGRRARHLVEVLRDGLE
jgi:Fe-S oxidoreductase